MFFFRKRAQGASRTPDAERVEIAGAEADARAVDSPFEVRVSLHSDVGCVREINEDSVRAVQHEGKPDVLVVVADGMGGHAAGEVASQKAVEVVPERFFASTEPPTVALKKAVEAANDAIFGAAKRDRALQGMGTTCTVLLLRNEEAWCAHVGDSRLYLVREGGIYQMSEDHSAVGELVRRGLLRAEEARGHPQKNVILRALGTQSQVEVAVWDEPFSLKSGDRWLLCSDGLSDLVEDEEILAAVLEHDSESAGQTLIEAARSRGGHDNISVALIEIRAASAETASPDTLSSTREVNEIGANSPELPTTREVDIVSSEVVPVETREVNIP